MTRGDVADDEWELIRPHLPMGASGPIPDLRSYSNAVMWRFRTGKPLARRARTLRLLVDDL